MKGALRSLCWVCRCVIPGLSAGGCLHIDSESMFGLRVSGHNTAFARMDTFTEPNQQVALSSANKPAWWVAASLGVTKILDGMRFKNRIENTKMIQSVSGCCGILCGGWIGQSTCFAVPGSSLRKEPRNRRSPEQAGYETSSVSSTVWQRFATSGLNTEHRCVAKLITSVNNGHYLQRHTLHLLLIQLLSQFC